MRIGLKTPDFYKVYQTGYNFSDIPTLCESDNLNLGDLVRFKDKTYAICMLSPANNFAMAIPVNINSDPEEEINDDQLKCPVCGSKNNDSWELGDEDNDYDCGTCGATLSYTSEVTRTFCANVKKMPEIKNVE